jgi:hypothetical protein
LQSVSAPVSVLHVPDEIPFCAIVLPQFNNIFLSLRRSAVEAQRQEQKRIVYVDVLQVE